MVVVRLRRGRARSRQAHPSAARSRPGRGAAVVLGYRGCGVGAAGSRTAGPRTRRHL